MQPITEEEYLSSSSSSSNISTATTVPVDEVFPAGATALLSPGNPFVGGLALQALPAQVIKCVMFCYMPLTLRP